MSANRDILSHDPTASTAMHRPDDRFVPLRVPDLATALAEDDGRFGPDAPRLRDVVDAMTNIIAQEALAFDRELMTCYSPFNPDRDTLPSVDDTRPHAADGYQAFYARVEYLLAKANFQRLTEAQIAAAVRAARSQGLKIRLRPERIQQLSVWVRGGATKERCIRNWRHPVRGRRRHVQLYRRLAIVFRLRDDANVLLKLFKEIPIDEVESLLPHAEVRMNWFDRLKLFGGGAGVVGTTATKVLNLITAVVYWSKILWIILIGGAILAFRAITGYRSTRMQRDFQRTRSLYYQNLDNNAGVIHSLLSMIAQEEVKEAALAYALCASAREPITSESDLAARVEAYLLERFGLHVRFDVSDAVNTVTRLGLWNDAAEFRVLPPDQAIEHLVEHWRQRRTAAHHTQTCIAGDSAQASNSTYASGRNASACGSSVVK